MKIIVNSWVLGMAEFLSSFYLELLQGLLVHLLNSENVILVELGNGKITVNWRSISSKS